MTKLERHTFILEELLKQGSLLVSELAERLDVSSVTIRKDLTELERAGKLYRSHGKAILINPFANNRSVNEKEGLNAEEKQQIGLEAAKLVSPNDSILLASGTTIHALARNLHTTDKLTVVSASLQATELLAQNDNVDIIQLGGVVRHSSLSVVGQYADMILKGCSFSNLDFGISTTDMNEAELNRSMIRTAQKTIVLADSSKFGRRGFARICSMDDIDMIITDSHISAQLVREIEELGIELIIAHGASSALL